jgi:hypothetical protein
LWNAKKTPKPCRKHAQVVAKLTGKKPTSQGMPANRFTMAQTMVPSTRMSASKADSMAATMHFAATMLCFVVAAALSITH